MYRIRKIDFRELNGYDRIGYFIYDTNREEPSNLESGFTGEGVVVKKHLGKYFVNKAFGFYNLGADIGFKSTREMATEFAEYYVNNMMEKLMDKEKLSHYKRTGKKRKLEVV